MSITIELDLPEGMAARAKQKGLLEPTTLVQLIARELQLEEPVSAYRELVEKMRSYPASRPMTMDEIQSEINALREERRRDREGGR